MANDYSIWKKYSLSSDSPEVTRGKDGNRIPEPKGKSLFSLYLEKFKDPLIIILCVILALSCIVTIYEIYQGGGMRLLFEPMGILLAIILSTGIGFIFEVKAGREFNLRKQVRDEDKIKVIRRKTSSSSPEMMTIRKCDIVKGDLVKLDSGDEVPADGRIVSDETVRVDESAYTGEPYTKKSASPSSDKGEEAFDKDFLLRGSIILEGSCYLKVSAVGADTEEGKGERRIQEEGDTETPLNRQLGELGSLLTKISYAIAGLIIIGRVIYYLVGIPSEQHTPLFFVEYFLHSVMIAVTLIVVAVPEGLPMSVTVSLALSMRRMLKENNLVRKLHACETMGATTVICTDKTGTLTQNNMSVVRSFFTCDSKDTAAMVAVNSTAELSVKPDGSFQGIGNPTEAALLRWIVGKDISSDYVALRTEWEVLSREEFSTKTKYMSTTARENASGRTVTFLKGAPEIVESMCVTPEDELSVMHKELSDYQSKAMRTLAFALKEENDASPRMVGVVGIADPVREGVKEAVQTCREAGVRVIMVTGDVEATAKEIGRQIGMMDEGDESGECITGAALSALTDEKAAEVLPKLRIVSRARPEDKARLVELLQKEGAVVAVTGDGTNDALALKKAQVGLSMGDGTARAKEVSDITILDNSFESINKGILWGRSLYMNIRRFIVFQMVINICACLVVLSGAFTGIDSPLNVTQMLWVNLIMDTFAAMALSSLPPDGRVMKEKPRNPGSHIINRKMARTIFSVGILFFVVLFGLWQLLWHSEISSVRDLLSLEEAKLYLGGFLDFSKSKPSMSPYESGVFFSLFVMMQFWNLFNVRYLMTDRSLLGDIYSFVCGKRKPSDIFSGGFLSVVLIILLGQILIVNYAGNFFEVSPLSASDWGWIILVTLPILLIPDILRSLKIIGRRNQ
ncbi:MAG: calcium-translocating P-type ATPase, PMCA-type [Bacteroidales bacterium]|nr:calcium-translocating P-type ATPase, PMCA-type [Bacteroidales bacterium]